MSICAELKKWLADQWTVDKQGQLKLEGACAAYELVEQKINELERLAAEQRGADHQASCLQAGEASGGEAPSTDADTELFPADQ